MPYSIWDYHRFNRSGYTKRSSLDFRYRIGIVIEVNAVYSSNADSRIYTTESGITTEPNKEHPENVCFPINPTKLEIVIVANDLHPLSAEYLMWLNVSGMVTEVKMTQLKNVWSLMDVGDLGKSKEVYEGHRPNSIFPINWTESEANT